MIQIYNQISFYINFEIIKIYNSFYEFKIKEIYFLVSFKFLDKFFLLSGNGSAFWQMSGVTAKTMQIIVCDTTKDSNTLAYPLTTPNPLEKPFKVAVLRTGLSNFIIQI